MRFVIRMPTRPAREAISINDTIASAGSTPPEIGLTIPPTRNVLVPRRADADPARFPLRAIAREMHVGMIAPHGATAHTETQEEQGNRAPSSRDLRHDHARRER